MAKLNEAHESSLRRLNDTHREKIALLDRLGDGGATAARTSPAGKAATQGSLLPSETPNAGKFKNTH